ncbi:unnamed protein product [Dicrocoelium dendriticum]|nr:unnamed protein product [Dicrocoelium dendriticum]CAH8616939.1 unnamed protein product [Dicrocoelium dendriticum]
MLGHTDSPLDDTRYYRDTLHLKHNLSFAGCGFLGVYHIGVGCCLRRYASHLYHNRPIAGSSAGAVAAAALICDCTPADVVRGWCSIFHSCQQYLLRACDLRFSISEYLRELLSRILPSDAHLLCSGRLNISLTSCGTGENIIVSQFRDKDELISAILCSSFLPFFSGFVPPSFRGQPVLDGGFSNNLLCLDRMTITVSPFTGEADICPMNAEWKCGYRNLASQQVEAVLGTIFFFGNSFHVNWNNFKRFLGMLWLPDPETFMSLVTQGYTDALRFLATRGFIACQLHRNPPLSSFIVRNHGRSSYHRLRYRFVPSSPVAASLAPPLGVTGRVAISSEAVASDLGSAYFYSTEMIGSGIGLNAPHCLACQNELLDALQSRLPTVLRTIIMQHRRPPHQRHGTTSILRLCTSLLTASRSSLRSGLSHVYTLGRHMFFSMLFQLDVLARLISS